MVPREHGAYGQLLLPMLTAMAVGRPSLAAVAIAAAAAAAFVSHEPLMVLLGRRGARLLRAQRRKAWSWLLAFGGAALCLGVTAIILLPAANRWTLLVPLASASLASAWIARGLGRTASGEVVSAAALVSVAFPVAVASSVSTAAALTCVLAFTAGFTAATVSVRAVIGEARGGAPRQRRAAFGTVLLLLASVGALAFGRVILPAGLWAASPMCAVALALAIAVPPPRYLRQIGWTLAGASVLSGVILVTAVR